MKKPKEIKTNRKKIKSFVNILIISVYLAGIYSGFVYSLKSGRISDYIKNVLVVTDAVKLQNNAFLGQYIGFFATDVAVILIIFIFKYSGVLKCLCVTPVFVYGMQKSVAYINAIKSGISVFQLIFRQIIKDTIILVIILLFLNNTIIDLIYHRDIIKNDVKKMIVFVVAIFTVNLLFSGVNIIFSF